MQDSIKDMTAALDLFTVKSSSVEASAVKEAGQKAFKVLDGMKANLLMLGIGIPVVEEAGAMIKQSNHMVTAWGMQTLMSSEDIMDETKGIALRGRLRSIFETHVSGQEQNTAATVRCKLCQTQKVLKVFAKQLWELLN